MQYHIFLSSLFEFDVFWDFALLCKFGIFIAMQHRLILSFIFIIKKLTSKVLLKTVFFLFTSKVSFEIYGFLENMAIILLLLLL